MACLFASAAVLVTPANKTLHASPQSAKQRQAALDLAETRSFTAAGIPGDPLNIAFFGSEEDLLTLMAKAGWDPADPITMRSALRISFASLRHRSYPDAPVSSLYVNGKKQDLAFEQELGNAARRHHVRFWKLDQRDALNRPLWVGAATHDIGIGISHANGRPTHHIAPDVDVERDKLVSDAEATGTIALEWIDDFQSASEGRNGGGDRFTTDRRMAVMISRATDSK